MPRPETPPRPKTPQRMFETRSQAWKEVGLLRQVDRRVVKRARLDAAVARAAVRGRSCSCSTTASICSGAGRHARAGRPKELEPPLETLVTVATVVALVFLGWALAAEVGRRSDRACSGAWTRPPPGRSGSSPGWWRS